MWVELSDGRTLGVPLAWFPRLLKATLAERQLLGLRARVQPAWERKVRSVMSGHLTEQRQAISDNIRGRYGQVVKKLLV